MSRPAWTPTAAGLRSHPQLAALAALDHQLGLLVGALTAVHQGQGGHLPELQKAREIARSARSLQRQIDVYRRLVDTTPKAASGSDTGRHR